VDELRRRSADSSPAEAMLQMARGFWVSRALYVAVKLGLADVLADGSKSNEELAGITKTHAASLHRLMRALAGVGVFAEDDQHRFALTPLGATLRADVPGSLRAWVLLVLGEGYFAAGSELLHTVRTGETAFERVFGMGLWQYLAEHSEDARVFDEAMANLVGMYNAAVLVAYPFAGIAKLVDVGGGNGSLLTAILRAHPMMKGVLFDLPDVAEQARRQIAAAGLADRCEVVAGDAFGSVPGGADAYMLSRVINSFDDEGAIAILRKCHRAMGQDAKLLLVGRVLPDRVEAQAAAQSLLVSDLMMLAVSGGRERTVAEHRTLMNAAGLHVTNVIPTQSEMTIIEAAAE
jgi:O-methyltransferase domain/Dimerisation domain